MLTDYTVLLGCHVVEKSSTASIQLVLQKTKAIFELFGSGLQ